MAAATNVFEEFDAWVKQCTYLQWAPAVNGGWERWAQVEFAMWLRANGTQTILEDPCFTDNTKKNDITIPNVACLELKVFNYNSETVKAYSQKLLADYAKLEGLTLDHASVNNKKSVIGLATEASLIAGMPNTNAGNVIANLKLVFAGLGGFDHEKVTSPGGVGFIISFCRPS